MNAERLHVIARALKSEIEKQGIINQLQNLTNTCQQIAQNPGNTGIQQTFASAKTAFFDSLKNAPSDSFPPAWKQIISEIGGRDLVGRNLKAAVEKTLNENQATLIVAHQQLADIVGRLQNFHQSLNRLIEAFTQFHIGYEQLKPGEAEIAVLIPRAAVHDKLAEFIEELRETKFILNTFSELATGQIDDLNIRAVSSSELMVYLAAMPIVGAAVAKAIDFVIEEYKKIVEIRKLQQETQRLQLPDDINERIKQYANTHMKEAIEKFAPELVAKYDAIAENGRRNEMTIQVKLALNEIAMRIDRGFNFEVRVEPPTKEADQANDPKVAESVQTIQGLNATLQYMKIEGPPILSLPERTDTDSPGGEENHKRKSKSARSQNSKVKEIKS